jgi:hypothetical protein
MVRSTYPATDADLTKRIAIAFATRPRVARHAIHVSVDNGLVTLRGKVPTYYDRQLIVAVTRHVAGVFDIDDWLSVHEAEAQVESATVFSNQTLAQPSESHGPNARRPVRRLLRIGFVGLALVVLAFTGCGKEDASRVPVHPASGALSFRGQPASGAFVSLHPKGGATSTAPSPRATVGPDGKFVLSTYDSTDGAPEGDYVLTVQWYKPVRKDGDLVGGPNVLPQKYSSVRTSDLVIKIAAGENQLQPIVIR